MFYDILLICALLSIPIALYSFLKPKQKPKKILVSIEGNIGVGKTSIMNMMKERFSNAEFIYEPVDEWHTIVDSNGKDILQSFYDDKKRWSYTFQNIAYVTRMNHIIDMIMNSSKRYIIVDRSLQADLNTFAQMLYNDNCLSSLEWNAYNRWNNFFEQYFGDQIVHKLIYLRCDPDIAYQRMQVRNRDAEKGVPFEYLKSLHQYHDKWLMQKENVLILDVNKDFVKNKFRFENMYKQIMDFI
ncbi:deoxynucleoside kinase [Fadolivirus algeromassiliense]|uniref:Deoxynucleoside kinase n=1 Tax=Fadolivirus FV1/VV64 TaxID=3070911 RepID=A0A7D3V7Q8_9VIRU|nr:deoxynucleoside kinase [Fadolivirus algeromassiliense]QKF94296.1 deoxynucleoside kinase [Fadolivirus FV1/VV64]